MNFFMNPEVALSTKLLECMYIVMGCICIYTGVKNYLDPTNNKKLGTAVFWIILGSVLGFGRWIPEKVNGILVLIMVLPAITKQVGFGKKESVSKEKIEMYAKKFGVKLFIPALSIGLSAIVCAFTDLGALVGIGIGVLIALILLMIYSKENRPKVFLNEASSTLSILGPLSLMPILLASLGAIFEKAGVGSVISGIVGQFIPEGNVVVGIIVFALGMVLFTMIMGNAFAAITVMVVGIAAPFVLAYGADPVVVCMIGLTSGYCGTLLTPMAANFNILPVALLDMKDRFGVIKNQLIPALILLIFQITYMLMMH